MSRRLLVCYDDHGREIGSWQFAVAINSLKQAPIESTNAINSAALVIAYNGGTSKILKSRYTDLDMDAVEALFKLRGAHKEVDDDRPRVDGSVCGHPVVVAEDPVLGLIAPTTSPCTLDTGHEGGHVPDKEF